MSCSHRVHAEVVFHRKVLCIKLLTKSTLDEDRYIWSTLEQWVIPSTEVTMSKKCHPPELEPLNSSHLKPNHFQDANYLKLTTNVPRGKDFCYWRLSQAKHCLCLGGHLDKPFVGWAWDPRRAVFTLSQDYCLPASTKPQTLLISVWLSVLLSECFFHCNYLNESIYLIVWCILCLPYRLTYWAQYLRKHYPIQILLDYDCQVMSFLVEWSTCISSILLQSFQKFLPTGKEGRSLRRCEIRSVQRKRRLLSQWLLLERITTDLKLLFF